jgi:hypothetical protein
MTGFPRYAIYFAAGADNALSRFGAELLRYASQQIGATSPPIRESTAFTRR